MRYSQELYMGDFQKIGKIYIEDYPENPLLLNDWRQKRNKVIGENF